MSDNLSIFQKIGIGINQIVKKTATFSRAYVSDYCPIVGVADKHSVFQDNSSLISIIKINGTTKLLGENEKKDLLEELRLLMQSSLRDENAAIQLVFQRDKVNVKNNLEKLYSPLRGKAKALRMNLDPIITDRINRILPLINEMDVYCVVYTYPMKLVSSQAWKDYTQERLADAGPDYPIDTPDGIQVYMTPDTVLHRHNSVLKSIENGLNNLHLSIKTLDAHECVYLFRTMLFPDETSEAWKARLPGDHIQPRVSQMQDHIKDNIDAYICPSIGRQIAAGSVDRGNGMDSIIRIGSRFVSTHVAKLLPAKPKSFEYFLEHVADLNIPIRFSFTMLGGADFWKGKLESKKSLAYMAQMFPFSPGNKRISAAGESIADMIEKGGDAAVGITMQVATWGYDHKTASERSKKVGRAFDAWGDIQSEPEVGDPLLAFTAGVPGWADNLRQPIIHTIGWMMQSLPLNVITSPWNEGTIFFKNKQGGVFPYQPLSSLQQTSNALAFAPPGGGKSVLISTLALGAVLDPVIEGMPKIAAIDIGGSAKGLIKLLKAVAPPELSDRFEYLEMELTDRFGINVFDIRLGCQYPTSIEKGFLTNFLSLILTNAGEKTPVPDAVSITTTLIDEAFKLKSEDEPTSYEAGKDIDVDQWVANLRDFNVQKATWWQIVIHAMENKHYDIASKAQRFAVPCIKELPGVLSQSKTIKQLYKEESIAEVRKLLLDFIKTYPSLIKPSTFTFQEYDVCVIDLNKVTQDTGPEGTRRTTIAYMISRYLLGKDFLQNRDILNEMPAIAQEYYRSKIDQLEIVRKYLIYDEFHRTAGSHSIRRTVIDDMRNGRKFNLMVLLASQIFEDFDEDMIKNATTKFILRVDSKEDAMALSARFGWEQSITTALIRDVRGAGKDGASLLLDVSGLKGKESRVTQVLTNYIGPVELAAYATTREEAALRDAVIDMGIPFWKAIELIGTLYPSGVKEELENAMKERRKLTGSTSAVEDDSDLLKGALTPFLNRIADAYQKHQKN